MDEQTSASSPAAEPVVPAHEPVVAESPAPSEIVESAPEAVAEPVPTSAEVVLPPEPEKTTPAPTGETAQSVGNEPFPPQTTPPPVAVSSPTSRIREFLQLARESITGRKKKKLEKILAHLEKHPLITNDEVEKLLRVSDATATRYLSELEKQGKIVQTVKSGRAVSYTKAL